MDTKLDVQRVERSVILSLRSQVLSMPNARVTTFSRDGAADTRHWAALLDNTVVGCASVMRLRGWALRGMAVGPDYRRQGIGARLLHTICTEVQQPMWCNARLTAASFYERHGWTAVRPIFPMNDEMPHQRMVWRPDEQG